MEMFLGKFLAELGLAGRVFHGGKFSAEKFSMGDFFTKATFPYG